MAVYAENLNYWQTGKTDPDGWIEKAKAQLVALGAKIEAQGFGMNGDGKSAYMLGFTIKGDAYKIVWPVLPLKFTNSSERAAKIQAATMLYHYVKAVALYVAVVGPKAALFSHYMLPDGRMASQIATDELAVMTPQMLLANPVRQLTS